MIPLLRWSVVLVLAATPQARSVSGLVVDALTRSPIGGARVLLARTDAPLAQSLVAETGDDGRFEMRNVPPGKYRWFVDGPGYARREVSPDTNVKTRTPIELTPFAVIAGRVLTERGDPAPRIFVRAWSGGKVVAESQTNDLGEYRLFDLPAGSYTVSAERYQGPRVDGTFMVIPTPPCPDCPGEGSGRQSLAQLTTQGAFIDPRVIASRTYPPVYFPAALDRSGASPIDVTPGQIVGGIEMRLILKTP